MSDDEKKEKELEKLEESIEITLKKVEIVTRHKQKVIENCEIIGKKLIESGEILLGVRLISNSYIHDNPKLDSPLQFTFLFQTDNKEMLKLAIGEHSATCDHHAAYYEDINSIPPVKIAEIVADLSARSAEQGTSLKDYLEETYYPKYNIKQNSKFDKNIKKFVNLLLEEKFKKL